MGVAGLIRAAGLALGLLLASAAGLKADGIDERALARLASPPLGLPPVPLPGGATPTAAEIALGRKLFFDRRLSHNKTMSCGMCHVPEQGFTNNELARPIGVEGRSLRRNAPTILNVAYRERLFHDGRETTLETQVLGPLLAREEMANPSIGYLLEKIAALPDYAGRFEGTFGGAPSVERIGRALAAWQRTMIAGNAPFDRWRYGGEPDALTGRQKRGFALFVGKAGCAGCHLVGEDHALFTDQDFHDTGIGYFNNQIKPASRAPVPVEIAPGVRVPLSLEVIRSVGDPPEQDLGRYEVTLDPADLWRYRTPGLRNLSVTAPYMHDGSLRTLEAVVRFYDGGGYDHPGLDPSIRPLGLTEGEIADLVAFLGSLDGSGLDALIADARSQAVGN